MANFTIGGLTAAVAGDLLAAAKLELENAGATASVRVSLAQLRTGLLGTAFTATDDLTIRNITSSGGITVTAGGLTVSAGGLTVSAGTTTVQALTSTSVVVNNPAATNTTFLVSNTTTTGANFAQFNNTGGIFLVGIENSAGTYQGFTPYDFGVSVPAGRGFGVLVQGTAVVLRATATGVVIMGALTSSGAVGFNGAAALAKPTITGSRGANVALANILTQLATYGLITDSTTV